jgi:hypothetical protein
MSKPWRRELIADLGADKTLDRTCKIPVRLFVKQMETGIQYTQQATGTVRKRSRRPMKEQ